MQKVLSHQQIGAFNHDEFVEDLIRRFVALTQAELPDPLPVTDVGGGWGYFAKRLRHLAGRSVRAVDMDPVSVEACRTAGIEASLGDALAPEPRGDEGFVTFNLILHHLVGASEGITADLQRRALIAWRPHVQAVFVNEYIDESWVGNASGRIIYAVTSSQLLSCLGHMVARWVPSLRANTFGVGVRFRAHEEWVRLFADAGFRVTGRLKGPEEPVSLPRRLLLIRSIRRDSFLLSPRAA